MEFLAIVSANEWKWTHLFLQLQCNREQLRYFRNAISDQSHATNLLAKPQSFLRYSTQPVAALDFPG